MSASADAIAAEWEFVQAFCRKRMNDQEAAADLAGDVIERALRNADRFTGYSLRAWLIRIARNLIIDHRRHASVVGFLPLKEYGGARLDASSETHATALDVRAAVSTLEPWQQRYCWLRGEGKNGRDAMFLTLRVTCKTMSFRRNAAVRSALAAALGVVS